MDLLHGKGICSPSPAAAPDSPGGARGQRRVLRALLPGAPGGMFEPRLAFWLELGFVFPSQALLQPCSRGSVLFGCLSQSLLGDVRLCLSCVFLNFTELKRSMGR